MKKFLIGVFITLILAFSIIGVTQSSDTNEVHDETNHSVTIVS